MNSNDRRWKTADAQWIKNRTEFITRSEDLLQKVDGIKHLTLQVAEAMAQMKQGEMIEGIRPDEAAMAKHYEKSTDRLLEGVRGLGMFQAWVSQLKRKS